MLTSIKLILVQIWSEILNIPAESLEEKDNFFLAGGDSISAYQVVIRVNEYYGLNDSVGQMFLTPDIQSYSLHINAALGQKGISKDRLKISKATRDGAIKASPVQQNLWYLSETGVDFTDYNHVLAFRIQGLLDVEALDKAINTIVDRHEILRTTFDINENELELCQVINEKLPVHFLVADAFEDDVPIHLIEHARHQFDLRDGPNLKVSVLKLGKADSVLVITIHDIVFDRWSVSIFLNELNILYGSFMRNESNPLPPLSIQYADYTKWHEEQYLSASMVTRQRDYWERQLKNAPTEINLPLDYERPSIPTNKGATEMALLPGALLGDLADLATEEDATLYMVLMAAFSVMLGNISGQDTVLVGTLISTRDDSALEALIGPFLSTVVLRNNLHRDLTFRQLISQTRLIILDAYKNKDLSFGEVIRVVNPSRSVNCNPVFQVMFAMQNVPLSSLELEGLDVTALPQQTAAVPFDLLVRTQKDKDRLSISIDYRTALFDAGTVKKVISEFKDVLEYMVENKDGVIGGYHPANFPSSARETFLTCS